MQYYTGCIPFNRHPLQTAICLSTKHKKDYTMKKIYEPPMATTIELGMHKLIAVSIPGKPNKHNNNEDWADSYDTNEYRSDWENIWADM